SSPVRRPVAYVVNPSARRIDRRAKEPSCAPPHASTGGDAKHRRQPSVAGNAQGGGNRRDPFPPPGETETIGGGRRNAHRCPHDLAQHLFGLGPTRCELGS